MLGVKVISGSPQYMEGTIQLFLNTIASEDLVDVRLTGYGDYDVTVLIIYKIKI